MITKVLVANRGEIAVRACRALRDLEMGSVAVFAEEDRHGLHRSMADEAYQIGHPGEPVRAYLDVGSLVDAARRAGADALYPGYGFLSEDPRLAAACAEAGLVFVGPPPPVLALAGDKVQALAAARAAGLPTLPTVALGPLEDMGPEAAAERAEEIGYPLFVKAAAGGGGRGIRLVEHPAELAGALARSASEADAAFGNPALFLEAAVRRPRHIEVQVLADANGDVVHLYERDCSVQRRHQKVVEVAPAPGLDPGVRRRLHADAVAFARSIGYRNAGTVEFLVDPDGRHVFIEMNPRIQVEHTVTEEVTGVDLVVAQLQVADGATLGDLGLAQDAIALRGAAVQCRVTTEDPAADFRPSHGRLTAYHAPEGPGVRLDANALFGTEVTPYFDSLLAKLTCRGATLAEALDRSERALAEFEVDGVANNLGFLRALLARPELAAGTVTTAFLADHPELARATAVAPGAGLLAYVAEVAVAQPHGPRPAAGDPRAKLPPPPLGGPPPGSRQLLDALGPVGFARSLRVQAAVAVTDTTFRDAHQSLLATRLRTYDMVAAAPWLAHHLAPLLSLEAWGGATYDVALRFLKEDPWDRLSTLREAVPNICLQMLLRGRNTVGYTPYPDRVAQVFVAEAVRGGVDIFRVFDAFNDVDQMRPAIEAVRSEGKVAEGTLCYSGDLASPAERLYTLDYYLSLAERLVATGCHVLCIKDMAGLLRPPAARRLVAALRSRFDLPVHLHTHDTAGGQMATYLAAIEAGVDAVDGAAPPLSGGTSQPSLAAIVAATDHTDRATGLSLQALSDLEPYWAAVRSLYAPFEGGLPAPTGRVYRHEIPGGQFSNLRAQATALGLGDRFDEIEDLYAAVDAILGRIVKVTPSSKVVGDLAIALCAARVDPAAFEADPGLVDLPDSVVAFLEGELGVPPGGWPEPFRSKALAGRGSARHGTVISADDATALGDPGTARRTLDRLLFPGPARDYEEATDRYGDLSALPTDVFFYGLPPGGDVAVTLRPGVQALLAIDGVSDPDEQGVLTVYGRLDGRPRHVLVQDPRSTDRARGAPKASAGDVGQIGAPFAGLVTVQVREGDPVEAGQVVATIEAMKMESAVTAPVAGVVVDVAVKGAATVEAGDLLLVLSALSAA
ncbi:MAG TPA: pyruvate carboxylase [Acidimicrobiales bacterium]|nr:pyruvate carboxylase [Acidimicrobiales bacterium]